MPLAPETEAKLSVLLTGMLSATKALNEVKTVATGFLAEATGKQSLDLPAAIAQLDELMTQLQKAIGEIKMFRHLLRDDRSPRTKRIARKPGSYLHAALEPHDRDPQEIISRMLANKNNRK